MHTHCQDLDPVILQSLVVEMMEKGSVLMRADGPYGVPSGQGWQHYDVLLIVAGGIGEAFSICLSLQDI